MKTPIREADIPWNVWYESTDREIRGKGLCDIGGESSIGVGLLELSPGCNTRPAHYHVREEEHLFALSGKAKLFLGRDVFELEAGSFVCFPAGQKLLHHLVNDSDEPFRYIMIGVRDNTDRIVYETDG
jgi:uncharacterized cupin superfamily protein